MAHGKWASLPWLQFYKVEMNELHEENSQKLFMQPKQLEQRKLGKSMSFMKSLLFVLIAKSRSKLPHKTLTY